MNASSFGPMNVTPLLTLEELRLERRVTVEEASRALAQAAEAERPGGYSSRRASYSSPWSREIRSPERCTCLIAKPASSTASTSRTRSGVGTALRQP